jgi:hypothetical protein
MKINAGIGGLPKPPELDAQTGLFAAAKVASPMNASQRKQSSATIKLNPVRYNWWHFFQVPERGSPMCSWSSTVAAISRGKPPTRLRSTTALQDSLPTSYCCLSRRSDSAKADPGQPSAWWEALSLSMHGSSFEQGFGGTSRFRSWRRPSQLCRCMA